jgi:hypothetical protein
MRPASVSASAGATRAQKPHASAMVFISASDSPASIQRAVFRASCIASFQQPPAADPRRLRLLDEPKLLLGCQQPVEDPITVLAFEAALLTRDREVRLSA